MPTPTPAPKVDFRKQSPDLYAPGRELAVVTVPAFAFLMVDGSGDPNTAPAYTAAVEALYALSYTVKFASKQQLGRDYTVAPLEGLWWGGSEFASLRKDEWRWTMMVRQPDWIPPELWSAAREKAATKAAVDLARLETLDEGLCVQYLHIGSYDDEAPGIARMHEWIASNGYVETGPHHEVYLSDPRRTAVEKLKTIVRQSMRPA